MDTAGAAGQPVLELKGIGKDFGAIRALHDVDMQVLPGEVVGLIGDNGAGKSTLMKIIAGTVRPSEGEILFDGRPVHFQTPRDARAVGIEMVYQDLALAGNLPIYGTSISAASRRRTFGLIALSIMHRPHGSPRSISSG